MPGLLKKLFLTTISTPPKREIFTVYFGPASQSIGHGRISREGALDLRESRERRDKIFAERQKTPKQVKLKLNEVFL